MNRNVLLSVLLASVLAACGKSEPAKPAATTPPAATPTTTQAPATSPTPAPTAAAPAAPTSAAPVATAPASPAPSATPVATPAATPTPTPAAAPAAATAAIDGAAIYKKSCGLCHASGVAGAPKYGDKAQWAPRIAQGNDTLYTHAIQGFKGKAGVMPAKGGNTSLSDEQVKAAVDYMTAAVR